MILAIIGSRTFKDYKLLDDTIREYFCDINEYSIFNLTPRFNKFVSGGAIGADSLGKIWCKKYNEKLEGLMGVRPFYFPIEIQEFLPDWKTLGKAAGYIRNEKIIKTADVVLAMWNGLSKGTQHSLGLAKKHKKPTFVVYF